MFMREKYLLDDEGSRAEKKAGDGTTTNTEFLKR
jgi:hypothetical protein